MRGATPSAATGRRDFPRTSGYSLKEIRHWLQVFAQRFYSFSQFKRSAMPNGPKVSHGGSLSPRGDWRAPSDMSARTWLDEIEREIPED
jgi:NAD+ synthase (glutamine-hydrolysing)